MTRLRISFTIALCFLFFTSYSQYDFAVKAIPNALIINANSVVRHSFTHIEMFEDKLIYNYDYAVTVLNKKHESKLVFAEHFHKKESKVKDLKISLFDADGELIKKIKKKEIKEYGLQDIEFADDTRSMIYIHQSPTFPITIHISYKHVVESPYYVNTWYPVDDFRQSLETANLTVTDHIGDSFNYQAFGLSEPTRNGNTIEYKLEQKKPFFKEKYMPDIRKCLPRLEIALKRLKYFDHVGRVNNWNEYGKWINSEMFLPKQDMDLALLKSETDDLIEESDSELEKAQKLYAYIQKNTRYVLIALKDGGLSPLSVSTVHAKKYGDCKALSYYYNTMCQAHGIDANIALVNAGDTKRSAQEDFYSSIQFNHVISKLNIDGKTYWVDCTSKDNPFNYLGEFTDDRKVLLIELDSASIVETPQYPKQRTITNDLIYDVDGSLSGTISCHSKGIGLSNKLYTLPKMNEQEKNIYLKEKLAKYSNPIVSDYSFFFDTINLTIKENIRFKSSNAVEKLGDHFKIKLNRNELKVPKLKKDKHRDWPIQFLRNEAYIATTNLKHDITLVPIVEDDIEIETEFGRYSFQTTATQGQITFKRQLEIKNGSYPPEKYNSIKAFFDKIKKAEKRSILLSLKS
ncbi:MAG: transglutaminase-like domain-containing protein [Bacteroidota bacterium]